MIQRPDQCELEKQMRQGGRPQPRAKNMQEEDLEMFEREELPPVPTESAYVANMWEYPRLTLAIFGLQFNSSEARRLYEESGIAGELRATFADCEGLLCMREFREADGEMMLQYWRSHDELAQFARRLPHMGWWLWLVENDGKGLSLYHEIYQCKTAEAFFQRGANAIGPATFCTTSVADMGEGRSQERQQQFEKGAAPDGAHVQVAV